MTESSTTKAADPFALLGLERRFDIDHAALQRAWLTKSASLHPDRAIGGESDDKAARLNEAKRTLDDPERRAGALMALLGGKAKEDDKSLPDGFLMEIMEIRQAAEDASGAGDREGVERFRAWADERRRVILEEIGRLFEHGDQDALADIRLRLNALRYIERMLEQVIVD